MPDWNALTTESLQAGIVAEADEQTLILTSGGRLSRQLRHAFRLDRLKKGYRGWRPPRVLSLNAWIEEIWRGSWPEGSLASPLKILQLWEEAVQGTNLPEGLRADIQLYQVLDETFRAKIRNKVPAFKADYATPLISWREEVRRRFEALFFEQKLIQPANLPIEVLPTLSTGAQLLPGKIFLVGFEFPAPIEVDLLKVLRERVGAIFCSPRSIQDPVLSAVSLPNQEEEVIWLCEQVLSTAQQTPLHRIGIVVPNFSLYAPLFSGAFRELIGPSINEEGGSYNLSLGQPLFDQPLVQAGLLPLRFFLEGQPRSLLLSLLLSPYYKIWSPYRTELAQADFWWRKQSVDAGLKALLHGLLQNNFAGHSLLNPPGHSLESLLGLLNLPQQSGLEWVGSLSDCWKILGFPAITEPGEEGFFRHLQGILKVLADDLKPGPLDGAHFYAWLKTLLSQTMVNEPGYEQAGIQVLGLIEARGLAFDHLFLAGLSKGSLPQAVRTFPFLTPEERRLVQGATLKSQFEFARSAFAHLKTASPKMTLTRPEEEKGDPLPPSPFWPALSEKQERNVWTVPGQAWLRAEWLKQTVRGMKNHPIAYPPEDPPLKPVPWPSTLSVTALEALLSCPFKFFAGRLLGLTPLAEIVIGIAPPERGEVLHNILALITKTRRQQEISLKEPEPLSLLIDRCVQEVLKGRSHDPHWQVEQKRLTGEGEGLGGLLGAWLEGELKRLEEGWRWEKEEISFSRLSFPSWSFSIQGRIDRIDSNEISEEVCCWDYKTGRLPHPNDLSKHFLAPQLPLYLMAVKTQPGLLEKGFKGFRAGYLGLKSEGEFVIQEPFKQTADWEVCLTDWEKEVCEQGKRLMAGVFPADPKPRPRGSDQGACTYCPYQGLCTYWKSAQN
ncbi:MAG: PD-(D/E)XK nuclease family protein [Pseudomonadota bacterium]